MIFLYLITITVLAFTFFACLYYYFLFFFHIWAKRKNQDNTTSDNYYRFAIVIPAHNEEKVIIDTLRSCKEITYPAENFDIVVVADNCDDNTTSLSRGAGVEVIERFDKKKRGKGFALEYAFSHLLSKPYDAYLVVDADCSIDKSVFLILSKYISRGIKVAQLNNIVSNPDSTPMTYALAVGNFMENNFFYSPKSLLGLAVLLRGTGMVLTREVLAEYPWNAYSVTEDIEYGVNLLKNGHDVKFIKESKVSSKFPETLDQLIVQRTRWAEGNLGFGRKQALRLIILGLRNKQWRVADAGYSFLVLSKPLILLSAAIAFILSLYCMLFRPNSLSSILFVLSFIIGSLLVIYFLMGAVSFGLSQHRLGLLLKTPQTILNLIFVSLRGLVEKNSGAWNKTPR